MELYADLEYGMEYLGNMRTRNLANLTGYHTTYLMRALGDSEIVTVNDHFQRVISPRAQATTSPPMMTLPSLLSHCMSKFPPRADGTRALMGASTEVPEEAARFPAQ